jgi:hypothetical protein
MGFPTGYLADIHGFMYGCAESRKPIVMHGPRFGIGHKEQVVNAPWLAARPLLRKDSSARSTTWLIFLTRSDILGSVLQKSSQSHCARLSGSQNITTSSPLSGSQTFVSPPALASCHEMPVRLVAYPQESSRILPRISQRSYCKPSVFASTSDNANRDD